ncbi:J domain-containing protein [Vibrio splendidus]|uniref:J domain-containing protein n=1 Tax=Vibrio splendidus TaxID=29497 RepID=UPI000C84F8BA|nr:DnaJ domain-containing protein [Vibrio splendidus]PMM15006.1 hypothetical protein BCT62_06140 [Vibrio splendidus]PMN24780.1 hypothetical protein BCT36_13075 [Vibrio splendidus]
MNYQEAVTFFELPEQYVEQDISASYRRLASEHHPDKGGDPEMMKKVNEAKRLLEEDKVNTNLMTLKQFETALRTIEGDKAQRRQNEKKVERLEADARNQLVGRLNSIKNIAYIASAISVGSLFLGKEVPKEIFTMLTLDLVEKPTVVEKPLLTMKVEKALEVKNYDSGSSVDKNDEIDEATQELVNKYKYESKKYENYIYELDAYQVQQERVSLYKKAWYFIIFYVAVSTGCLGWWFKNKSRRVELELDEFIASLAIKSRYARALKEAFNGVLPKNWTLQQLELSLSENESSNSQLAKLNYYLGTQKLSQLLIAKGVEQSFLSIAHSNDKNDFEESYSLS